MFGCCVLSKGSALLRNLHVKGVDKEITSNLRCYSFLMHVSDPRVLNRVKEGVLHWACQSQKENEEVVKLILGVKEK